MSPITPEQDASIRAQLRAMNARETCPICDAGRWTLELGGLFDLLHRVCAQCGHVLAFDLGRFDYAPPPILCKIAPFPDLAPDIRLLVDGKEIAASLQLAVRALHKDSDER